jgi:hypothetical protein
MDIYLVEPLERLGHLVMNHQSNVRTINPHAKGHRSYHALRPTLAPIRQNLRALRVRQPCMIRARRHSGPLQRTSHLLCAIPGMAVNDAAGRLRQQQLDYVAAYIAVIQQVLVPHLRQKVYFSASGVCGRACTSGQTARLVTWRLCGAHSPPRKLLLIFVLLSCTLRESVGERWRLSSGRT